MSSSTSDWEPPSPDDLQRLLPQYEITGILGRGGMGAVYDNFSLCSRPLKLGMSGKF